MSADSCNWLVPQCGREIENWIETGTGPAPTSKKRGAPDPREPLSLLEISRCLQHPLPSRPSIPGCRPGIAPQQLDAKIRQSLQLLGSQPPRMQASRWSNRPTHWGPSPDPWRPHWTRPPPRRRRGRGHNWTCQCQTGNVLGLQKCEKLEGREILCKEIEIPNSAETAPVSLGLPELGPGTAPHQRKSDKPQNHQALQPSQKVPAQYGNYGADQQMCAAIGLSVQRNLEVLSKKWGCFSWWAHNSAKKKWKTFFRNKDPSFPKKVVTFSDQFRTLGISPHLPPLRVGHSRDLPQLHRLGFRLESLMKSQDNSLNSLANCVLYCFIFSYIMELMETTSLANFSGSLSVRTLPRYKA